MVVKIRKGFLAFLAVIFAAVLCAVGAFWLSSAQNSAFAEEIADEVAVASVSFGDKTTTHSNMEDAFNKANEYASGKSNPAVITLLKDRLTNTASQLTVAAEKFVTLDLNGHKLHFQGVNTGNSPITVAAGGTFTLTDRQPNTEHRYNVNEENGLYEFTDNGEHTLKGGVITGGYNKDTDTHGGGCIYVSGTFIMQSGTIAGNQTTYNGGGVYVDNATFEMRGGSIVGNSSGAGTGHHGGGVYSTGSSTFTMSGGIIKDNHSGNNGGGVYINKGTFNLSGGTITGNTAVKGKNGGGVYVRGGELNVSGTPVVTGNTVEGKDNNLYVEISTIAVSDKLETTKPVASAQIGLTLKGDSVKFSGYYNDNNKLSELSKYFIFDNGKCTSFDESGNCKAGSNHTPGSTWELDGIGHWNDCTTCHAKVNYAVHVGDPASCTGEGFCTVCEGTYGPNGHKFVYHAAVAATCTAQGYKEYWYCPVCDKNYSGGNTDSPELITDGIIIPIDSSNHNFDTEKWVSAGGSGHYHPCLNGCDAQDSFTGHNNSGIDGVCSDCKYLGTSTHTHNYNQETKDYLKSAATCEQRAVYFKSCACGEKGTETFEYGDLAAHDITSIGITTQPTKKSYTAFDTFDTAGMVVKTHCGTCDKYLDEVDKADYSVVYLNGDCLHAGDDSVDIEYNTMTATVEILPVAKKQVQVIWQYTEKTNNTAWGEWVSQFVYNPDKDDLNTRVRATFNDGNKDYEYRASNRLVTISKNGTQISSTALIKNVGTFTLALDEDASEFADYEFTNNSATLSITPLTIELSSKTEKSDFYWLLADYDSALQTGYVDNNFNYSSSGGDGFKRVERSIVRNRNKQVEIELFGVRSTVNLGDEEGVYEIKYQSGNTGKDVGEYTAKAVMTLKTDNYKFAVGAFSADRQMTAQLQEDGSVLITKTWYIANMGNALLSQDAKHGTYGEDWDIADWTYGAYVPQMAPRLEHGDPGEYRGIKDFAQDDTLVTFKLYKEETTAEGVNKILIGSAFNRYEFNSYIDGSVPAGSYVLEVHVGKYTSIEHVHWYDGTQHDGQAAGIFYDEYEVEYRFKVAKAQFAQTNLDSLANKTYRYTYDGQLHFYDDTFTPEAPVRAVRSGIWSDAAYDSYYGLAHLHYNLDRWNTEAFLDPQEISEFKDEMQKPQGADTYKIYYEMYAPNYEDFVGDSYFTVIIGKAGISKPSDMTEAYSGSAKTYAVADSAQYKVTGKASFTNAGNYSITLTLKDSVNYAWKNADGTLSSSNTVTVKLIITKAQVVVPAERTEQINGNYVYTVPQGALYEVQGNAEFTEAGDYEVTLKLKDYVNYEWKTAEGKVLEGETVKTALHLSEGSTPAAPSENGGASTPDIWLILDIIMSVIIACEVAYIVYRLLRKNKDTEGEEC